MTEIALALAMGFFAVMVLTLVSMGGGERANPSFEAVRLARAAADSATAVAPAGEDVIVIYDGSRFLDTALRPIDPAALAADATRRIVLAVDPAASFATVMAARARIPAANLVVANLDARWLAALATAKGDGR